MTVIIMVKMIIVVNARFLLNEYDDQKLLIFLASSFTNHHVAIKNKLQTVLSGKLLKGECTGYELRSLNLLGSLCT